jgi:hypothetical protein
MTETETTTSVEYKSATYFAHPTTGLVYKSDDLWIDPVVAFVTRPSEFRRVMLSSGSEGHRTEELSKLKAGEWVRYHV